MNTVHGKAIASMYHLAGTLNFVSVPQRLGDCSFPLLLDQINASRPGKQFPTKSFTLLKGQPIRHPLIFR